MTCAVFGKCFLCPRLKTPELKVLFYGIFRSVAGGREMESAAQTIDELFDELSRKFGSRMEKLLSDDDVVEGLTILCNDRALPRSQRGSIRFAKDDVVKLLSPIGGG